MRKKKIWSETMGGGGIASCRRAKPRIQIRVAAVAVPARLSAFRFSRFTRRAHATTQPNHLASHSCCEVQSTVVAANET